ncbi:MAG: hypothetical protein E5Y52_07120 [Mesorhizobium sp.]|nr:MAG: hypothetical protein E5Y52_07120 [Mesorhizobium sp.]
MKSTVLGETDKANAASRVDIESLFPEFAKWDAGLSHDDWKATDVTSEVQDYGTVNWKGRNLDGVARRR